MRHDLIYINNLTTSFSNQQMRQHILPSGAARVRTPGPLILGAQPWQRGLACFLSFPLTTTGTWYKLCFVVFIDLP